MFFWLLSSNPPVFLFYLKPFLCNLKETTFLSDFRKKMIKNISRSDNDLQVTILESVVNAEHDTQNLFTNIKAKQRYLKIRKCDTIYLNRFRMYCNERLVLNQLNRKMACFVSIAISFTNQRPIIICKEVYRLFSKITMFKRFNILMKSFAVLFTIFSQVFRKVVKM